jgi:hypothetical protein
MYFFDSENISFDAGLVLCIYIYIHVHIYTINIHIYIYICADNSLARHTTRCILFDGGNISFDASFF